MCIEHVCYQVNLHKTDVSVRIKALMQISTQLFPNHKKNMYSHPKDKTLKERKSTQYALQFTIETLVGVTMKLNMFGLAFCVIWSILFDFEKSTKTHCGVKNFAPSISSAIGTFLPQKYVYQVVVSVLMVPRFLCLLAYKKFYELRIPKIAGKISWMVEFMISFHSLELISLLGLTIVPSKENFNIHKGPDYVFLILHISILSSFLLQEKLNKKDLKNFHS